LLLKRLTAFLRSDTIFLPFQDGTVHNSGARPEILNTILPELFEDEQYARFRRVPVSG
jgi:hypothetical protein